MKAQLRAHAHIMGKFLDTVKRPQIYFEMRYTYLDCRGTLEIHEKSHWGFGVTVLTLSHDISRGVAGFMDELVDRPVIVKKGAWIASGALLYNCIIGEGAVVAIGSVVRSCEVAPGTMVAGNPAEVVARWDDEAGWVYDQPKWRVLN